MRYFSFLVFNFLSLSAFGQAHGVGDTVSTSVGRFLLYQDLNARYEVGNVGLGHYYLPEIISEEYTAHISKLKVDDRIRFFWGVISFAKFGTHGTEKITLLIRKCCEKEFIESAREYLEQANNYREISESYVDESMVSKADFFLRALGSYSQ